MCPVLFGIRPLAVDPSGPVECVGVSMDLACSSPLKDCLIGLGSGKFGFQWWLTGVISLREEYKMR